MRNTPASLFPNTSQEDSVAWNLIANERFSIQSAWNAFRRPNPMFTWAKVIWYKHGVPRWSIIQ